MVVATTAKTAKDRCDYETGLQGLTALPRIASQGNFVLRFNFFCAVFPSRPSIGNEGMGFNGLFFAGAYCITIAIYQELHLKGILSSDSISSVQFSPLDLQ